MADEPTCIICGGSFYADAIDENGKCKYCAETYPGSKNYDEAMRDTVSEKEQHITLTEERVRAIILEVIAPFFPPKKDEKKSAEVQERMAKARAAKEDKKEKKTEEVKPETE